MHQKQQQALLLLLLTRCGRLLLRNVLLHTISFHATGARGGGGLSPRAHWIGPESWGQRGECIKTI